MDVFNDNGSIILSAIIAVDVELTASVTLKVMLVETAVVGLPEIFPLVALRDKPSGKAPAVIDQL
jgi:hypothetical protein